MRFTLLALAVVVVASSTQFPGVIWVKADPAAQVPGTGAPATTLSA